MRRMFKVASPNTELIVVDAQTNSIVRVSKNLESKYRIPTPLPTREEAIARALDTAANLQGMPRMQVEQPVIAIESVGAQGTEMELKELEREFDRAITGKANAES